jgi:hypothetical protein
MAQKEHDRRPEPLKPEEAAELERALQSDDIAPVDQKTFGMRLAENHQTCSRPQNASAG